MIASDDIGKFGADAFVRADKWKGVELDIAGDVATMPEAAAAISTVLGRTVTYQPIPIQLTLRYFDPSGFEWIIAREAFVISSPYMAHTTFLGNTASLPAGFDGSAIVTSTSPRVFGVGTVIDYARPSAVPGQPPADRAGGWNLANAAGFIN